MICKLGYSQSVPVVVVEIDFLQIRFCGYFRGVQIRSHFRSVKVFVATEATKKQTGRSHEKRQKQQSPCAPEDRGRLSSSDRSLVSLAIAGSHPDLGYQR
jgi:hypothetical protein